jgi:Oligoketide cyclase/lipid transport protein
MPQIIRSALVPFSAEQMFALVNDVEAYPSFCPDV